MEHYVIVNDWANNYEIGTTILGVAHSLEEAKEIFNASLSDEKQYAEEHGFEGYDDCETVFDAGENGYYCSNHTNLYIQMVK
jgi:hypothetical protein